MRVLRWWRQRTRKRDEEIARELQSHLAYEAEELQAAADGGREDDAYWAARRTLGNISIIQEATREMWTITSIERLGQDFRYALRTMRQSPGFAAVAILSLGLGIGATTAIFSVIHAVLIDPFPYRDVSTIMSVIVKEPAKRYGRAAYQPAEWLDLATENHVFSHVGATTVDDLIWTRTGSEPERLRGSYVTPDTFHVYDVPALLGRTIEPVDGLPDAPGPVAVLGYKFWQRQFGGKADVLGQSMTLNGKTYTIVGVMPARFGLRGADVYAETVFTRSNTAAQEDTTWVHFAGRLKPGITAAQAAADLQPIIAQMAHRSPNDFPPQWQVHLESFSQTFASDLGETLLTLLGAVALLLLLACANVSNLLLARATAREREFALRASLGAGRARLIRQLLTESLVLAGAGGVVGTVLAYLGLRGILALMPPFFIPTESQVSLNGSVLAATLAVSLLTAFVFGLAPALASARPALAESLKSASKGGAGADAGGRASLRSILVTIEVALSLMLLVGASLLMRTLVSLQQSELPFAADRVLTFNVPLAKDRYPDAARRSQFLARVLERVRAVPGVTAASLNTRPPALSNWSSRVEVVGGTRQDAQPVFLQQVDQDYVQTLHLTLVAGRMFSLGEVTAQRPVALVNEAFVRRYLPETGALGRVVKVPELRQGPVRLAENGLELIGVVRDVSNGSRRFGIQPELYLPYTLTGASQTVIVASSLPAASIAGSLRRAVYALDAGQPVTRVQTVAEVLAEEEYARPRFSVVLFGTFAGIGLLLAIGGVAGVIAYSVARRTPEFGVRLALGAQPRDILALVFEGGARLVGTGIALGLIGSLAGAGLLRNLIWGVSAWDPWSFGAVALLLVVVGAGACWWPARHASRVDPLVALRYE